MFCTEYFIIAIIVIIRTSPKLSWKKVCFFHKNYRAVNCKFPQATAHSPIFKNCQGVIPDNPALTNVSDPACASSCPSTL